MPGILTTEQIDALEKQHGQCLVYTPRVMNGSPPPWMVVFRKPKRGDIKNAKRLAMQRDSDLHEIMAIALAVYPERAQVEAMLEDYPAAFSSPRFVGRLEAWMGFEAEEEGKG